MFVETFYLLNFDCLLVYIIEARNLLLITICKHIRYHIGAREEIQLCTDILGEILTFLFHQNRLHDNSKVNICSRRDLEILSLSTLDMLIETCLIVIDRMVSVLVSFYLYIHT